MKSNINEIKRKLHEELFFQSTMLFFIRQNRRYKGKKREQIMIDSVRIMKRYAQADTEIVAMLQQKFSLNKDEVNTIMRKA